MTSKTWEDFMGKINTKIMLLSILLLCYPLVAQEVDFTGKWQLNREKMQSSDFPDVVIEITQKEGIVDYTQNVKSSDGEFVTHMVLSLDGKESAYRDYKNKELKCSCVLEDGVLKIFHESHQRRSGKWVIVNIEEEHSLSPDGKTLSVIHYESWGDRPRGRWPNPMVFDKIGLPKSP
jgi:hypothetical protein